jgi:hypothetical protein
MKMIRYIMGKTAKGGPMRAWNVLAEAIRKRNPVRFKYNGIARVACPHKLGYDANRRERVLVCQTDGVGQRSGGVLASGSDWRCLFVDLIRDVTISDGPFRTPGNYSAGAPSCMTSVFVEVPGRRAISRGTRKPKAQQRQRKKQIRLPWK